MIVGERGKGLGRVKGWVLALLLGMLAVPAQAETITSVTQYAYDAAGRPTCTAVRMNLATFGAPEADACVPGTPGTDGPDRITYTGYDDADRVTTVTTGYGSDPRREIKNDYRPNGTVGLITDGENNTTSLSYDGFDRPSYTHYPMQTKGSLQADGNNYQLLSYDAANNVTQVRRRDTQTIDKTYDALNRLTFEDKPGTAQDTTYTYDNLGRVKSSSIPGRSLTMVYDALGRLTEETSPLGTMRYGYDLAGRRIWIGWPDWFWVAYDYDLAGEVTSIRENGVTSGSGVLMVYFYDDLGRRTSGWPGDGSVTWYAYDAASRLSAMNLDLAGTASDQVTTFTYNAASQQKRRTSSNAAYDFTAVTTASPSYQANGLNQYVAVGASTKGYDRRGNYNCDSVNTAGVCGGTSYDYDIDNRLYSVSGGGVTTSLSYDAAGRLFSLARGGSSPISTRFLYSGQDLVAEFDGAGTGGLLRRYVPGPGTDEPIVWYEGTGTTARRWLRADERGSVAAITGVGSAVAVQTYDEYGVPGANNTSRFQYTGQIWLPEIGLYHYKARAYSPTLGRFLQTDPIGYGDGLNWYAYVGNDPLNRTDPTGMVDEGCGTKGYPACPASPGVKEGNLAEVEVTAPECNNACMWENMKQENLKRQLEQNQKDFSFLCGAPSVGGGVGVDAYWWGGASVSGGGSVNPQNGQISFSMDVGVGVGMGGGVHISPSPTLGVGKPSSENLPILGGGINLNATGMTLLGGATGSYQLVGSNQGDYAGGYAFGAELGGNVNLSGHVQINLPPMYNLGCK